jgi:hypothetical protein
MVFGGGCKEKMSLWGQDDDSGAKQALQEAKKADCDSRAPWLGASFCWLNWPKLRKNWWCHISSMPLWRCILFSQFLCFHVGALFGVDPFVDEERYRKVVSMVGRNAEDDFPDPATFENEEDRKARFQWIATEKDIVPHLMRMLDFDSRIRPNDGVCFVLEALSLRKDLSEDQLRQITDHMRELLKTPWSSKSWVDEVYLTWGALVLQNYPSPENQELALMLLSRATSDHYSIHNARQCGPDRLPRSALPKDCLSPKRRPRE